MAEALTSSVAPPRSEANSGTAAGLARCIGHSAAVSGSGTLQMQAASPRGIVNFGPVNLTHRPAPNLEYNSISGVYIAGAGCSFDAHGNDTDVSVRGSRGVCFDSGGLDLKPAAGMLLMKKDMGGAAHALALAQWVMATKLPVNLRLLIPAVENAVSGNAFRPGDVLRTRKGISVEVGNTDAEGRLVLCDALAEAVTEKPDLLLDFATLTGAARVALGPELPALFSNDDALAGELLEAGQSCEDPLWRMPLHRPYRQMLASKVADINNVSSGGFAGAITAALFLQEFVPEETAWAHIDLMAWNNAARPGRPVGGEAMSLRAAYRAIAQRCRRR